MDLQYKVWVQLYALALDQTMYVYCILRNLLNMDKYRFFDPTNSMVSGFNDFWIPSKFVIQLFQPLMQINRLI